MQMMVPEDSNIYIISPILLQTSFSILSENVIVLSFFFPSQNSALQRNMDMILYQKQNSSKRHRFS